LIGGFHAAILDSKGDLWTTGYNEYGQLGTGDDNNSASFIRVAEIAYPVISVAVGAEHTVAVDSQGNIWVAGDNLPIYKSFFGKRYKKSTTTMILLITILSLGSKLLRSAKRTRFYCSLKEF
jgi:alpha-tubulin suppressor-like RCC1 family protein